jgi:hypothetical protein
MPMKLLLLIAGPLTLAACGPALSGDWHFRFFFQDGTTQCSGKMAIRENTSAFDGTWQCDEFKFGGALEGHFDDPDISFKLNPGSGWTQALMTGTATDKTIDGVLNGSGFTNAPFKATR